LKFIKAKQEREMINLDDQIVDCLVKKQNLKLEEFLSRKRSRDDKSFKGSKDKEAGLNLDLNFGTKVDSLDKLKPRGRYPSQRIRLKKAFANKYKRMKKSIQ